MITNLSKLGSLLLFAVLQENNISRLQITSVLGYTSKTSIDRIAQENAGDRALLDFFDRIQEHPDLLDKDQSSRLFRLVTSIIGKESTHEWLLLLKQENYPFRSLIIRDLSGNLLPDFSDTYGSKKDLVLYIHGCLSVDCIHSVSDLLRDNPCRCYHYLRLSDTSQYLSRSIRCLFPIIFYPNYYGYIYDDSQDYEDVQFVFPYNCLFLFYTDDAGNPASELLILEDELSCLRLPFCVSSDIQNRIISVFKQKKANPIVNNALSALKNNYIDYILYCEKLEHNHAIYQYKPDFGMEQIPSKLVFKALREGSFLSVPGMDEVMTGFVPSQTRRYENNLFKTNEQIHIFKESALRSFAETGMMSDHFWGMRPFTVEERYDILASLIKRIDSEPNYRIYLLDDEDGFTDSEITLYEDSGLSIIKPHTSYLLSEGHSETIIAQSDFSTSFKYFFSRELIPRHCKDKKATVKILRSILATLKTTDSEFDTHKKA